MKNITTDLAKRLSGKELDLQTNLFVNDNLLGNLLDKIPDMILILNEYRQIVFVNKQVVKLLSLKARTDIYGKRTGEIFDCVESCKTEGGCGTADACPYCGAFLTITEGLKGKESNYECRILKKGTNDAYDFRVSSSPLNREDGNFIIFSLADISDVKRKEILERIFFHDILNTAAGISSISELLNMELPDEYDEYKKLMSENSRRLIDEIVAQRQLVAAEKGELVLNITTINSLEILLEMKGFTRRYDFARDNEVLIDLKSEEISFKCDRTILGRILLNLMKNSLEAVFPDGTVTICSERKDSNILFWVKNSSFIPPEIQVQIFKRSFSTKGIGRGIGTYSIKMFTENYLKGKVYFESSEKNGTTFYVEIPLIVADYEDRNLMV